MPLDYAIQHLPHLVIYEVTGEATLDDMHRLIDAVAEATVRSGDRRVLVNLLGVRESLKFTDHYAIGEQVARRLGHLERLASVVPGSRRTGASEKVANAQGTLLRVFVNQDEALAWLASDAAPA